MKIEILDDHKLQRLLDHPDSATAMKAFGELLRRRDAEIGAFGRGSLRRCFLSWHTKSMQPNNTPPRICCAPATWFYMARSYATWPKLPRRQWNFGASMPPACIG